jgi:hypothetical protein
MRVHVRNKKEGEGDGEGEGEEEGDGERAGMARRPLGAAAEDVADGGVPDGADMAGSAAKEGALDEGTAGRATGAGTLSGPFMVPPAGASRSKPAFVAPRSGAS